MVKILILGGHGFLGQQLCEQLTQSKITLYSPNSAAIDLSNSNSIQTLLKVKDDFDRLVFLSAITPDNDRSKAAHQANIAMANHVAQVFSSSKTLSHITYVSSDAVYGDIACDNTKTEINEQSQINPNSDYGEMHCIREKIFSDTDIPTAILRPTMLYGHNDSHTSYGVSRLVKEAINGPVKLFGKGEEQRDYIHVDDAASYLTEVVVAQKTGTWNLASGQSISFYDLAKLIEACQKQPLEIEYLARIQKITHKHFNIQHLKACFPNQKIRPLKNGISQMVERNT